eukprot:175140_1
MGRSAVPDRVQVVTERGDLKSKKQPRRVIECVMVVALIVGAWFWAEYTINWLPKPKGVNVEPGVFSEARARKYLEKLVSFGPKTVGSNANEVEASRYILGEIEKIKSELESFPSPNWELDVDLQHPSGAFHYDILKMVGGFTNVYANITNIVARIRPRRKAVSEHALLLSAHFDTAMGSPGASDDCIHIANMLEILRNLAYSDIETDHAVIFNFNGAEESFLQAAHGFITQHKWAPSIRAFINLEAAGTRGAEILFQAGPRNAWLALAYAEYAPYPAGNSILQDVFETGLIPGDTDYRIYSSVGAVPGLDFALLFNAYDYHTHKDDLSGIDPGQQQHTGDNMLAVVRGLLQSPFMDPSNNNAKVQAEAVVYFDMLRLFMVAARRFRFMMFNWAVIGAVLFMFRSQIFTFDNLKMVAFLFQTCVLAIAVPVLIAQVLTKTGLRLRWYAHPAAGVTCFVSATLLALTGAHAGLSRASTVGIVREEARTLWATLTVWVVANVVALVLGLGSCFAPMIVILCLASSRIIYDLLKSRIAHPERTLWPRVAVHCVVNLFPFTLAILFSRFVLAVFIPVLGRSGTEMPADSIIALICSALAVLTSSLLMNLLYTLRPLRHFIIKALVVVCVLSGIALAFTSPYSAQARKRIFLQHTERTHHNPDPNIDDVRAVDSGIWINPMDSLHLDPLKSTSISFFDDAKRMECKGIFCDMPWYLPLNRAMVGGWYIPAPPPDVPFAPSLRVVSDTTNDARRRVEFRAHGPDHMSLHVNSTRVAAWSFTETVPESADGTRFVFFAGGGPLEDRHIRQGQVEVDWDFWIEVDKSHPIRINFATHFLTHPSQQLIELKESLPDWVEPVEWVCVWESYNF